MTDYESIIAQLEDRVRNLESMPSSRAKSIAITHLQTAILWLEKARTE